MIKLRSNVNIREMIITSRCGRMTFDGFPQYFSLFAELEDLVKQKFPHEYETFRFYNMDLAFKLRYLELICLRYENDKKKWQRFMRRASRFIKDSKSLSEKEYEEESTTLGKQMIQYSELLMLDIDSFFVFARVLLDRSASLLKPFYKGIVTKQDVVTRDFREYLDWFENNYESVLDAAFYDKMMSFSKWFYKKLREPRNEIIVHPRWDTFRSEISSNGKVKRIRYKLQTIEGKRVWIKAESTELPNISKLFEKIIEFLEFLNGYFSEKLRKGNEFIRS